MLGGKKRLNHRRNIFPVIFYRRHYYQHGRKYAVGTVGLTLGVTPQLSVFSQFILIVLMYLGRVGGLTLIYAAISNKNQSGAKLPLEKITVG